MGQVDTASLGMTVDSDMYQSTSAQNGRSHVLIPALQPNKSVSFALVTILVMILIKFIKEKSNHSKSSKIPWSPSLPLIGSLHHVFWNRHDIPKMVDIWMKKYPTIFQTKVFGQKIAVIFSPDLLRKLLLSSDPGHLDKPQVVYKKLLFGHAGKGLFVSKVHIWEPHRKLLQKAFHYEMLKSYVSVFTKHANKLVKDLDSEVDLSVGHAIYNSCLEIISEIALGVSFQEALSQSEYMSIHHHINRYNQIVISRFNRPWLLSDFLWNRHPDKKELDKSVTVIDNVFRKVMKHQMNAISIRKISEEYNEGDEPKIVLEVMMQANWPEEEILAESATVLLGGHETISVTMKFLLFLLASQKEHQVECQKEVDRVFSTLEKAGEEISIKSISELKYLERCVKETLRIFPAVAVAFRHLTAPLKLDDDIELDPDTIVAFTIWGIHRSPQIFPNPDKFDPNRFLAKNCKERPSTSYLPFTAGPRNCIGWKMAMLEITTIAAVILRHFDLETTDKLEDVKIEFSITIFPKKELNISLKRRTTTLD